MKKSIIRICALALMIITVSVLFCLSFNLSAADKTTTITKTPEVEQLMQNATSFLLVRGKQLGASHYAYTDSVSDHDYMGHNEYNWNDIKGSKICLVTLEDSGDGKVKVTEKAIIKSNGVLRDPDVSPDGTKFLFSQKKDETDDYHIYEYDFTTGKQTQLTFGNGAADVEPVYTANGSIVFSSTRDQQTVDCWYTPVMNLYVMDGDGKNITRVGYDQVHTTYPTSTSDGRILYTRWDYNDRNQMFVQALFQMFPDGSNQTEVFGNDVNNPSTLLHTRDIPGQPSKYITIISGHHMFQVGKLAIVDLSKGRNTVAAVKYLNADNQTRELSSQGTQNVDNSLFQQGTVYKFPYAYSDSLFTVSMCKTYGEHDKRKAAFEIVLMDAKGKPQTLITSDNVNSNKESELPASQLVPIKTRNIFNRASILNYANQTATYYLANVYEGESMKGVKAGDAKYLRVVGLDFRAYAIGATNGYGTGSSDPYSPISTGNGAWDVKDVLGIVDINADGSALFSIPAGIPVYFQVLDENGGLIQTMRSWTTGQNGEYFSCVGCHLDKNTAPPTSLKPSEAMKKGVQKLQPDKWMSVSDEYKDYDPYSDAPIGFDFLNVVQPILNTSCVTCHSNTDIAYSRIKAGDMQGGATEIKKGDTIFELNEEWEFTKEKPADNWFSPDFDSSEWGREYAPFGQVDTAPGRVNTVWKDSDSLWLRKKVQINSYDVDAGSLRFELAFTKAVTIYVNGTEVYSADAPAASYTTVVIPEKFRSVFKAGENLIAVKVDGSSDGRFFGLSMKGLTVTGGTVIGNVEFFKNGTDWNYRTSSKDEYENKTDWTQIGFDDSSWKSQNAPFGNRVEGAPGTDWNGSSPYVWLRKTFEIKDVEDPSALVLKTNIFYDDDIYIYVNGNLVFSNDKWNDKYEEITLTGSGRYLVEGKNVIAVSLHQHEGGYEFDMSLNADVMNGAVLSSDAKVSLESYTVLAPRMHKYFPVSYLVLTGSRAHDTEWVAEHSGNTGGTSYLRFISSMSQCEALSPYAGGSTKSSIIKKLRNGHGNLTDEQIRAIECWIDLAVPCFGSYAPEGYTDWTNDHRRISEEETNKRNFYDMLDKCAKMDRGGLTPEGEVTLSYGSNSVSGTGVVSIFLTKAMAVNNEIKVTLPKGEKYLGLCLTSRIGESIIYCPDGTFTFKIPKTVAQIYPETFLRYTKNQITARVVSESELAKKRNLALNSYDLPESSGAFPHVTTDSLKNTNLSLAGRNVIDGFTANRQGAYTYPAQSWQPANDISESNYLMIDYGRTVNITELAIKMRAMSADTWFTVCKAEFSDGTVIELNLKQSDEFQRFDIGSINTTYVKLTGFVSADPTRSVAITEVQTIGTDIVK